GLACVRVDQHRVAGLDADARHGGVDPVPGAADAHPVGLRRGPSVLRHPASLAHDPFISNRRAGKAACSTISMLQRCCAACPPSHSRWATAGSFSAYPQLTRVRLLPTLLAASRASDSTAS